MMSRAGYVPSEELARAVCAHQAADSLWEDLLRLWRRLPTSKPFVELHAAPSLRPTFCRDPLKQRRVHRTPLKTRVQKTRREHVRVGAAKQPGPLHSKDCQRSEDLIQKKAVRLTVRFGQQGCLFLELLQRNPEDESAKTTQYFLKHYVMRSSKPTGHLDCKKCP